MGDGGNKDWVLPIKGEDGGGVPVDPKKITINQIEENGLVIEPGKRGRKNPRVVGKIIIKGEDK